MKQHCRLHTNAWLPPGGYGNEIATLPPSPPVPATDIIPLPTRNTGHCVGWFRDRPSDISRSFLELFATSPSIKPRGWIRTRSSALYTWINRDKLHFALPPLRSNQGHRPEQPGTGESFGRRINGEATSNVLSLLLLLFLFPEVHVYYCIGKDRHGKDYDQ